MELVKDIGHGILTFIKDVGQEVGRKSDELNNSVPDDVLSQ